MATFLANDITAHVQVMFPLKYKKNVGYLKTFFLGCR